MTPGSPGYGLYQARDASLQAAKPEQAIEKDTPGRRIYAADAVSAAAGPRTQMLSYCAASAILRGKSQSGGYAGSRLRPELGHVSARQLALGGLIRPPVREAPVRRRPGSPASSTRGLPAPLQRPG